MYILLDNKEFLQINHLLSVDAYCIKCCDGTYICECGYIEDRDINAALNLRDYGLQKLTA